MAGLGFCSGGNEAALGGPLSIKSCRFMNLTGFGANFGIFGASRNILFSVLCCTLKGWKVMVLQNDRRKLVKRHSFSKDRKRFSECFLVSAYKHCYYLKYFALLCFYKFDATSILSISTYQDISYSISLTNITSDPCLILFL